jgi:uncharacterized membrane protein
MAGVVGRLREGYWVIPSLCLVAAGILALTLVRIDEDLQRRGTTLAFAGGPDSARSLLSTISTSMLSLTALTFSITMVVLQLASSQFSPRAMQTFLRDRQNQLTLGVFLATYVYALLALREIRGTEAVTEQFVPGLTVALAFVLVLVSIAFFVAYIHHIATSIQVARILERIDADAHRAMRRLHPDDEWTHADGDPSAHAGDGGTTHPDGGAAATAERRGPADSPTTTSPLGQHRRVVPAPRAGVLAEVRVGRLVRRAAERDAQVRLLVRPGDFVPEGAPLLAVEASGSDDPERDDDAWLDCVRQVGRREEYNDVTFGLRQLVDIAERALSPGVNDPSTASQCLDHLHDLLRRLATLPYPPEEHADEDGRVRLLTPQVGWDEHVRLVVDEIRLWGSGSLQVRERLQRMVEDLLAVAPPARQAPLRERLPLFTEPLRIG